MNKKWYGINKVGNIQIIEAVRETEQYIITAKGYRYKKKSNAWNYDIFYFNYYSKEEAILVLKEMKEASDLIFKTSLDILEEK